MSDSGKQMPSGFETNDDPRHTYDLRPRVETLELICTGLPDALTRIEKLEAKCHALEARLRAEKGAIPMDRGMKVFPEGDPIPSKSIHDLSDGKTYIIDGVPLAFVKNTSGRSLCAGEGYRTGRIDTQLRSKFVEPNNFVYLELEPA